MGGLIILLQDFLCNQVIKYSEYGYKNRHIDKCNRLKSSEIDLHLKSHLIFEKGPKQTNGWPFRQMVLVQLDIHIKKKKS